MYHNNSAPRNARACAIIYIIIVPREDYTHTFPTRPYNNNNKNNNGNIKTYTIIIIYCLRFEWRI